MKQKRSERHPQMSEPTRVYKKIPENGKEKYGGWNI